MKQRHRIYYSKPSRLYVGSPAGRRFASRHRRTARETRWNPPDEKASYTSYARSGPSEPAACSRLSTGIGRTAMPSGPIPMRTRSRQMAMATGSEFVDLGTDDASVVGMKVTGKATAETVSELVERLEQIQGAGKKARLYIDLTAYDGYDLGVVKRSSPTWGHCRAASSAALTSSTKAGWRR